MSSEPRSLLVLQRGHRTQSLSHKWAVQHQLNSEIRAKIEVMVQISGMFLGKRPKLTKILNSFPTILITQVQHMNVPHPPEHINLENLKNKTGFTKI